MLPPEILEELDLLDEGDRAELAGICLNTIDISTHHIELMVAKMDEWSVKELLRNIDEHFKQAKPECKKHKRAKKA